MLAVLAFTAGGFFTCFISWSLTAAVSCWWFLHICLMIVANCSLALVFLHMFDAANQSQDRTLNGSLLTLKRHNVHCHHTKNVPGGGNQPVQTHFPKPYLLRTRCTSYCHGKPILLQTSTPNQVATAWKHRHACTVGILHRPSLSLSRCDCMAYHLLSQAQLLYFEGQPASGHYALHSSSLSFSACWASNAAAWDGFSSGWAS